jgi:hypothetical protein
VPAGFALVGFALEYRECAPEHHRRALARGLAEVVTASEGFASGDRAWTDSFSGVICIPLNPGVALVPTLTLIPAWRPTCYQF